MSQAYSALGSGDRPWRMTGSITSGAPTSGFEVLENPELVKIAEKHGKTVAQVREIVRNNYNIYEFN